MTDNPNQTRLEAEVARARQRVAEARDRRRTLAFREAGVDVTTGVGKAVERLYDGDPYPESIREFMADNDLLIPLETDDDE